MSDVNGDGLADMVEVRNQGVDIYLNDDGMGWTVRHTIEDTPFRPAGSNYVRLADINGSGTPDIVWGQASDYRYIDLTGGKVPAPPHACEERAGQDFRARIPDFGLAHAGRRRRRKPVDEGRAC